MEDVLEFIGHLMYEPCHEKTGFLPLRKQKCISDVQ